MAESSERHAGWLELFYDLLFVVLIAQLAHSVVADPGWESGLRLLVLFLPAWWVWVGSTIYTNLTAEVGAERRLDVLGQMAIVLVMAASAEQAAEGHPALFAGAYAASRLAVLAFRILAGRKWPAGGSNWPLIVSAALWTGSIWLEPPWAYVPWFAGLVIEVYGVLRRRGGSSIRERLIAGRIALTHLVERFGGFMIIVFGEGIAQIVAAVAGAHGTPLAVITGLAAFSVLAMLWWLYFDYGSAVAEKTMSARRAESYRLTVQIFVIGHFLPVVALVAFAAGLNGLVTAGAEGHDAGEILRLCAAAMAVYLINNAVVGRLAMRYSVRRVLGWLMPNLIMLTALTIFADELPPAVALFLVTLVLTAETLPRAKRTARESAAQEG
ncbi:low temperature requirement protein A [Kutzneria chonburiensis]|uniref:Low temperature requirement protein A n=1 Tax=Kutzneria chonburiensis TaxID=1483604 RepID=A0ABV6MSR4_9PSEU|nr:low temperature requirement protein A [Kutzneria chonburiensis]